MSIWSCTEFIDKCAVISYEYNTDITLDANQLFKCGANKNIFNQIGICSECFLALSLNLALYRTDSYNRKMENIFKCELVCTNLDMVLKNKVLHPWMVSNCYYDCFWLKFCSRKALFLWMRMATGNVFEELISQWYATHFTILTPKFLRQRIS